MARSGLSFENKDFLVTFLGGLVVSSLGWALAAPVASRLGLKNKDKGAFLFLVAICNSSFLPLPLAKALWGEQGTYCVLGFLLGNNLFLMTVGIAMLRSQGSPKSTDFLRAFLHPQALGFGLGILLWALKIPIPAWLFDPVSALGEATLPLAMLATGGILALSGMPGKGEARLLAWAAGLKLLALPFLVLCAEKAFKINAFAPIGAGVLMLEAAMPSLASAGVYAHRFGGNASLAASGSLITTLICPLTLPVWMALAT